MKTNIAKIVATSLGFGYMPVAPGTFGAVFGIICYLGLIYGYGIEIGEHRSMISGILFVGVIVATAVGTWSAAILQKVWGHDASKIVIDETLGVWITLLCVPFTWVNVLLAFVLFRFFDILKPLGIRAIDDNMHTPFSVMLDDIVAGIYAAIVLQIIIYVM